MVDRKPAAYLFVDGDDFAPGAQQGAIATHPRTRVFETQFERTGERPFGHVDFVVGDPVLAEFRDFDIDEVQNLFGVVGGGAGAHQPHTGVDETRGARVHAVGQPALFTDHVEQTARQATAENVVHDVEGFPIGIVAGNSTPAEYEVYLFGVVDQRNAVAEPSGCAALGPAIATGDGGERLRNHVEHLVVLARPGDRHDHRAGAVVAAKELTHMRGRDAEHRFAGTCGLAAEWVGREQLLGEQAVHHIVGAVVVHRDLFQDHMALGFDIGIAQRRGGEDVAQQPDAHAPVALRHPGDEGGVFLVGERVDIAATAVDDA